MKPFKQKGSKSVPKKSKQSGETSAAAGDVNSGDVTEAVANDGADATSKGPVSRNHPTYRKKPSHGIYTPPGRKKEEGESEGAVVDGEVSSKPPKSFQQKRNANAKFTPRTSSGMTAAEEHVA